MTESPISPTFCIVPWTQLATNPMGAYRVCCSALSGKNLVRDDENKPMFVHKNKVKDIWNSQTYQKVREQMLNGERPEMCERCFREEDSGAISARLNWNKMGFISNPKTIAPLTIKHVDLRLGNLCNLKCRMCNPYSSNKWVDDWNNVSDLAQLNPAGRLNPQEQKQLKTQDWTEQTSTWNHLADVLQNVEEIYLTGGEPFLSLEQARLLQNLIDNNRSSSIIIRYNTNLTTLPERLVSLWPQFKLIRLNISFDAYGALNDYIRFPSKWRDLENNLSRLIEIKELGNTPLELHIHTTVQMYNILSLTNIFDYFIEKFSISPYINILNHPHCLNIRTLPPDLREETINKLHNHPSLKGVAQYLSEESWFDSFFGQFVAYTKKLDEMRGQSWLDHAPEFKRFF